MKRACSKFYHPWEMINSEQHVDHWKNSKYKHMKKFSPIIIILLLTYSCKSKKVYVSKKRTAKTVNVTTKVKSSKQAVHVVKYAKTFNGTRYKYGGIDKRGIDCSGLVQTSFKKYGISLPRTTSDLKHSGTWIDIKDVTVGDLVFFATKKNSRKINHVGIVTNAKAGSIEFIHASSSKGVMLSSLVQRYWYFAFVQARRIL